MKNDHFLLTGIIFLFFLIIPESGLKAQQLDSEQHTTEDVKRLMEEGIKRMEDNEMREAIQLFDQGREIFHKIVVAMDERNQNYITSNQLTREAERLIQQNDMSTALEKLNEAIRLNDENIEAYKYRGSIRLIKEQQKESERDRNYIGLIHDYTNAIRITDRKIRNTPRHSQERKELEKEKAKLLINRAYVKMMENRSAAFHSAIEDYSDAIRNDDQNWDGYLGRAVAYNKTREYRREVNDYLRAVALMQEYNHRMSDEEWGNLYLTIARAYVNLRDSRNAFEFATKAYNLGNQEAERIMNRHSP